jgi:hypothetical protein
MSLPPNGQGLIAALMMPNLLERTRRCAFQYGGTGPNSDRSHSHTYRRPRSCAYADLARHVADPAFYRVR